MTTGGGLGPARVSRRRFLAGAGAGAASLAFLAACESGGSRGVTPPPDPTGPSLAPTTTTPPIPAKQAIQEFAPPVPSYVRSGPANRARVGLTVDDLFGVGATDSLNTLLDVAKSKRVLFTFFPTGGALEGHLSAGRTDVWKRVVNEGHEIGNHGYTHKSFLQLSSQDLRNELVGTQQRLDDVLGPDLHYTMRLVRPPGGAGGQVNGGDSRVMSVISSLGCSMVMWTIDSNGTGGDASFLAKIVDGATNGSIVLTHFTTFGVDFFAPLIDRLRNEKHLAPTNITGLFV
jgi:peptidoglycan/xylan/chitin deacetylase (PgdA/CDA1 family)